MENLEFVKSYVSRPMRPGETDGDMYYFISDEEFKEIIEDDWFLEYAYVHQAGYYGTKKSDILDGIEAGKILMSEVDYQGLAQMKENIPEFKKHYTTLFLNVPEDTMIARNKERNPDVSQDEIDKRLISLREEAKDLDDYDYVIDATQTPEQVMEDVLDIMNK